MQMTNLSGLKVDFRWLRCQTVLERAVAIEYDRWIEKLPVLLSHLADAKTKTNSAYFEDPNTFSKKFLDPP